MLVDVIFVPQGAEYQAVLRGLARVPAGLRPRVYPLAIGPEATEKIARNWLLDPANKANASQRVLLMGLCGSLQPEYGIGDGVLCDRNLSGFSTGAGLSCDRTLNATLIAQAPALARGTAITVQKLVHSAQAKQALANAAGESVAIVEMEGYALLDVLQPEGFSVSMLRVVSDDCQHDLPDLTVAIAADGSIKPLPLAGCFLRQPLGAIRLIYGSLQALNRLQQITQQLFQSSPVS